MPIDIAIHALGTPIAGNLPPAPMLPVAGGQKGLAEDALSNDLVVTGTSMICVVPTAKLRMDIRRVEDVAAIDAGNSVVVLAADQPRYFTVQRGTYKIKTLAYA